MYNLTLSVLSKAVDKLISANWAGWLLHHVIYVTHICDNELFNEVTAKRKTVPNLQSFKNKEAQEVEV